MSISICLHQYFNQFKFNTAKQYHVNHALWLHPFLERFPPIFHSPLWSPLYLNFITSNKTNWWQPLKSPERWLFHSSNEPECLYHHCRHLHQHKPLIALFVHVLKNKALATHYCIYWWKLGGQLRGHITVQSFYAFFHSITASGSSYLPHWQKLHAYCHVYGIKAYGSVAWRCILSRLI